MSDLVLEYDLHRLPSAQHKAGLAGLLLCIESMKRRRLAPCPEVLSQDGTKARLHFTPESLQALFDDLYDAELVEQAFEKEDKKRKPKRIDQEESEKNGKKRIVQKYIYDAVQPRYEFLRTWYPNGSELWLKLMRDMLWGTLRGIPKTRLVYDKRAAKEPSSIPADFLSTVSAFDKAAAKGRHNAVPVVSSLFIGAQDSNAEDVPFLGDVKVNLLLHFWLAASLVYVPRVLKLTHSQERGLEVESRFKGYVLVIPEPAHLGDFCSSFQEVLATLDTEAAGYRPAQAIIDLPEEGGLEFLHALTRKRTASLEGLVAFIELYHLEKQGNNVRILSASRLQPNSKVVQFYDTLRKKTLNPIYKVMRLRNELAGQPWYAGAEADLLTAPIELFVYKPGKSPARLPFYGRDLRQTFAAIKKESNDIQGGNPMQETDRQTLLASNIQDMIQAYVRRKAEEKSGERYEDFAKGRAEGERVAYPEKYREALERVCSQAFLAMRGRRDKDFVEFFTGSICSVPQFLPDRNFQIVSQALVADWELVKTLSLLALSACSWLPKPQTTQGDAQ